MLKSTALSPRVDSLFGSRNGFSVSWRFMCSQTTDMSLVPYLKSQIQQLPESLQESVERSLSIFQEQIKRAGFDLPEQADVQSSLVKVFCCSQFISESCIKNPGLFVDLAASSGFWTTLAFK